MTASLIHTDFIRKHPAQAVLTALGLSGAVLVFLPFEASEVPVEWFFGGLDQLSWRSDDLFWLTVLGPCVVLPFAISAGYLRWLLTGGLSRWESAVAYTLALIVVVLFSLVVLQAWRESHLDVVILLFFASLALGLGAGVWFVIQALRDEIPPPSTALVAMQLAYLPLALGWLAAFPIDDFVRGVDMSYVPIGAHLTFLTVFVYTIQAALSVKAQPRLWLRGLPLALVWAGGLTTGFIVGM